MASGAHAFWRAEAPLLLASTSPTRRALLAAVGLSVDCVAAEVDERAIERGLGPDVPPMDVARHLAAAKADAVAARFPGRIVLGADQVLDLDGRTLSKPIDAAEACAQLARLSGRTHRLHAAFALRMPDRPSIVGDDSAALTLRDLVPDAIARYVAAAGPAILTCAGGYQIEGLGLHLVAAAAGDHTTILGLPMMPLLAALRRLALLEI